VLGYDTSTDNARTDLAAWQSGPPTGGWVRLDALDALGAGLGVAEARAAVVHRGVLVVGGISSDRAVVWRTSPAAAVTPPQVTTTIPTPWWVTHGEDDLCRMAPPVAVTAAVGPVPARPRLLPEPAGPTVSCTWLKEGGDTALQIQIAPARRLDVLAANYPAGLPTPKEVDGVCEGGTYYPAFATLVARCGDTAVAVGGLPQDTATILMKVFVEELDD